jgi:hypothetical protein
MSPGICPCGFNLEKLPGKHDVHPDTGLVLRLTCPLCGSDLDVSLQSRGVLLRGKGAAARYARWQLKAGQPVARQVSIGEFQLRFETLDAIEPREICHARVPAFVTETGDTAVPTLPVRPAYFDCIDHEALERALEAGQGAAVVGGEYQVSLPLAGLDKPEVVRLPVYTYRSADGKPERALRDVNVRIWPNAPIPEWRAYLVGVSAAGPGAAAVMGDDGAKLRVRARAESDKDWREPLAHAQRGGASLVGDVDRRPRWLSFELLEGGATSEAAAGGVFVVPRAPAEIANGTSLQMGLDFGTSNTCVAFTTELVPESTERPRLLPVVDEKDWNIYLVRGGKETTDHAGPDLWPSPIGFGSKGDLFASELLFPRSRIEQMSHLDRIGEWRLGIDFGAPRPDVAPTFTEAEFTISDFKWAELLTESAPTYAGKIGKLQTQYLVSVLLSSYLRIALAHGVAPAETTVVWSYPSSFHDDDWKTLSGALEETATRLHALTGVDWKVTLGADESTAAAANAGELNEEIQVYLDMGGGSTDIAVKFTPPNAAGKMMYLGSVRYAGMALLNAFPGEGPASTCLAGKATVDILRRRVREATSIRSVLGDPTLFDKKQEAVRRNRILHFYSYVVEHVARTLAAGVLDQRFMLEKAGGGRAFPPELRVAVFFLGNGWRFQGAIAEDFESALSDRIWERTGELIEGESSPYGAEIMKQLQGVEFSQRAEKLRDMPHEKAAVALGLISPNRRRVAEKRAEGPRNRGILGWTTQVGGTREVPWFAMVAAGSGPQPPGERSEGRKKVFGAAPALATGVATPWYERLPDEPPVLDWRDGPPAMPASIESPFDLDERLRFTRARLQGACHAPHEAWFTRGAFEVMLEELFRKKLKTIGP